MVLENALVEAQKLFTKQKITEEERDYLKCKYLKNNRQRSIDKLDFA